MRYFLSIFILFVSLAESEAQNVVVLDSISQEYRDITQVSYLFDPSGALTLADVSAPGKNSEFILNTKPVVNLGMTGRDCWLKFPVVNRSDLPDWFLEIHFASLKNLTLYLVDGSGKVVSVQEQGISPGNGFGKNKFNYPLFTLNLPDTSAYKIYLHISTYTSLIVPINIYSPTVFSVGTRADRDFVFLLLGIIAASVIFNLLLFFLTQEKSYLFLSIYMFFIVVHSFFLYGYGYIYIDWLSIALKLNIKILLYSLICISHSLFAIYYLNMRKGTFLFRLFIFIVVVFSIVFAGVLSGVIPLLPGNKFITFSFLVLAPIDVTAGIIIYRRGFKPAIYYVVAFSLTILAAILTTSTFFGVDQSSFIGLYSHLVSSSFFALVITMGLSEKISALRAERLHNRQLITDKLDLRIEISERKEKENALLESEAQLLSLNATKDKFFSIIAHDLMNPFHAIIAYSNDMLEDLKENDIKRLERNTGFLNELAENTYSLLNNLLIWSRSQTGQISFNPVYLDISDIIAGSVKFFETIASAKSVTLINNVSSRISVKADSDMIKTIFRNLISNAIKYTYKGGRVTIDIQQNNDFLEISVTDTGIGIDDDKIDRLFSVTRSFKTLGTGNEPGTGLGLILCKEFITYHNGFISAKSSSGRGTTFTVKLPL